MGEGDCAAACLFGAITVNPATRIAEVDESKCTGCGACAKACHEGAIEMINGKAKLTREDYCDGLGDCLPACPVNAITFEEREAPAYDEAAVKAAQAAKAAESSGPDIDAIIRQTLGGGCPGSQSKSLRRDPVASAPATAAACPSHLSNWPVQIKLAPVNAPYFNGADLLIAADCCAYACGSFHNDFMKGKVTLIGCPKLDAVNYAEKLAQIIAFNKVKSVTVARMTVPCCGGMSNAVKNAVQFSGKNIPLSIVTIGTDGTVINP